MHIANLNSPPPIEELRIAKLDKLERGRYTWEKKYAVVALFLRCGNMREVEESLGVPVPTISNWRQSNWWPDLVNEIKNTNHSKLDNKLSQIINKAIGVIEDRLDNGEMVLNNKTGEMERKPVNLRDATRAASELMSRQDMINKTKVEQEVQKQTVEDTLKFLASEFAKMVNTKPQSEIIDLEETSDAIYEEASRQSGS